MIVRNDFSSLAIVILVLIAILCVFGILLGPHLPDDSPYINHTNTPRPADFNEPARAADILQSMPGDQNTAPNTNDPSMATVAAIVGPTQTVIIATIQVQETRDAEIRETQIIETFLAGQALQASATPAPPAGSVKEGPEDNILLKSLPALLIGIVVTGIAATIIIVIAIADRFRNEAALRQQEIEYHRLIEQRRLAELRAAEIKARRVREGTVRAPSATYDVHTSRTNGNGHKRYANSRWPVD